MKFSTVYVFPIPVIPSNKSDIFRKIKLSKKETYGEIADSGRRPRGSFDKIFKPQLTNYCELIFDGHITKLNNTI